MMDQKLQKKIDFAIRLIQSAAWSLNGEPIEVAYSGGKDSDVILQLTKEANISYRAIYKCTTIDPPGTIKHAKEVGAEIIKPKETFFELIARKGFPSRNMRFCCEVIKEYKILDKQIQGIRKCESKARMERYQDPTACRIYGSKKNCVEIIYPILDWSNDDLLQFINDRKIKLHPLYYKQDGSVDITRRLGCIGCPMASTKKRVKEFSKYPRMVKLWCKAERKFFDSHPNSKARKNQDNNEYDEFCRNVFCRGNQDDWWQFKHTLFGETDCKKYLQEYFRVKL